MSDSGHGSGIIDIGYTHPLDQLSVGWDPWGHHRAGLDTPPLTYAQAMVDALDAAHEDSEGRMPLVKDTKGRYVPNPEYSGSYWTGINPRPVDPEFIARRDKAVDRHKHQRAIAYMYVVLINLRDAIAASIAEQQAEVERERTRQFLAWVNDRNRRRERERADKAKVEAKAAAEAKRAAGVEKRRLEREAAKAKRNGQPATATRRRTGGPSRDGRLPEPTVQRAHELYYTDGLSFIAVAKRLIDDGLVPESDATPTRVRDRLRREWKSRGWEPRSGSQAQLLFVEHQRQTHGRVRGGGHSKLTDAQINAALLLYCTGDNRGRPSMSGQRALRTAQELWEHNVDGARELYSSRPEFARALRRLWDKNDWHRVAASAAAYHERTGQPPELADRDLAHAA